jgi:hypothetical protein
MSGADRDRAHASLGGVGSLSVELETFSQYCAYCAHEVSGMADSVADAELRKALAKTGERLRTMSLECGAMSDEIDQLNDDIKQKLDFIMLEQATVARSASAVACAESASEVACAESASEVAVVAAPAGWAHDHDDDGSQARRHAWWVQVLAELASVVEPMQWHLVASETWGMPVLIGEDISPTQATQTAIKTGKYKLMMFHQEDVTADKKWSRVRYKDVFVCQHCHSNIIVLPVHGWSYGQPAWAKEGQGLMAYGWRKNCICPICWFSENIASANAP